MGSQLIGIEQMRVLTFKGIEKAENLFADELESCSHLLEVLCSLPLDQSMAYQGLGDNPWRAIRKRKNPEQRRRERERSS